MDQGALEVAVDFNFDTDLGGIACTVCGRPAQAVIETITLATNGETSTKTYSHGTRQCVETTTLPPIGYRTWEGKP